jgi:predicted anti-sigma-YlaC factor YlaD
MKCTEMEIHAIEYMDGELSAELHTRVETHLTSCSDCRERLEGFASLNDLLDSWAPIVPSATFNARLEREISAQKTGYVDWWKSLTAMLDGASLGKTVLAGALTAILLVAIFVVRFAPNQTRAGADFSELDTIMATIEGSEDLILYSDLQVLENFEMLSNFEILQELNNSTP